MKEKTQKSNDNGARPEKSLVVAIEQIATLLRSEVKSSSDKMRKMTSLSSLHPSFTNTVEQIAKLLRAQIHEVKTRKKRSWKKMKQD